MPRKNHKSGYDVTQILTSEGGILRVGSARATLLTESAFVFMQRVIHEQMPEFTNYGFYEMGYRAGLDLSRTVRRAGDAEKAFRAFIETYRQSGYGNIEVVAFDFDKPEVLLRGRNLIEAAAARDSGIFRTPRAVDHYSRGMFAGLFSQLLGKEVICEELSCQYRGDPACEFSVMAFGGGV